MRPTLILIGLLVLGLACCDSAQAQRLGRGGGYGFNRPTGGYGFVRPSGGYGFTRTVGPVGSGIVRPGYGGYYPGYGYPVVGPWGAAYGFRAGYGYPGGYYGPAGGYWGGSGFMLPGISSGGNPGPKVYQSLQPKPASKDGQFTLPGSRTTLSFPTIKTSRNRSRTPASRDKD